MVWTMNRESAANQVMTDGMEGGLYAGKGSCYVCVKLLWTIYDALIGS